MAHYFFHIDDGEFLPDREGVELPDLAVARREALKMSGAMLRELDSQFWTGGPWRMHVHDADNSPLFTLEFSALDPGAAVLG
ncbi:MAG TPA: hypothetical protein VIO94_09590 [Phenylobacterium sp.]